MRRLVHYFGSIRVASAIAALAAGIFLSGPRPVLAEPERPVRLPPDARYGEMKAFAYPLAQIDKASLRLAPGARIYNTHNMILMPVAVPPTAKVLYKLDGQGNLAQMWLLTPEEAAAAKKRTPVPKTP